MNPYLFLAIFIFKFNNVYCQKETFNDLLSKQPLYWESTEIKEILEHKNDKSKSSKQETENWIVEKLNSYVFQKFDRDGKFKFISPIFNRPLYERLIYEIVKKDIHFNNNYLVFSFKYKITSDDNSDIKYKETSNTIYMSDLINLSFENNEIGFGYRDDNSTTFHYNLL